VARADGTPCRRCSSQPGQPQPRQGGALWPGATFVDSISPPGASKQQRVRTRGGVCEFKEDPQPSAKPKTGFSRRGFIRGVGLGGGAVGTGLLEREAVAAPAPANVAGPGPVAITLTINGKPVNVTVEPRVTLLDAMRNYLDLTGAKRVCDRGTCGACTVILRARPCTVAASWLSTRRARASKPLRAWPLEHPASGFRGLRQP